MGAQKDPAAVALGRKRQANMTDEEKRAFQALGTKHAAEANRRRPPEQRRQVARKAAMTRRRRPKWISEGNVKPPAEGNIEQARPMSHQAPAAAVDELARAIDELPDDTLAAIAAALAGRL